MTACTSTGPRSDDGFAGPDASVGRVTSRDALLWLGGRPQQRAVISWRGGESSGMARATLSELGSAHVRLGGLEANTAYEVTVKTGRKRTLVRFRSAPAPSDPVAVHFVFGGDLAGQNACRDAVRGYEIFEAMAARNAKLLIGLGDMIYADGTCAATGPFDNPQLPRIDQPLRDTQSFMAHWRYNYADPAFANVRHNLIYEPVWDDHEIVNDFGPTTARSADAPDVDLLSPGREAFIASNPVAPPTEAPEQLYRRFRYGQHAEFFLLDARQYRDANALTDTGVLPKSLLGASQRRWLLEALSTSTATWKFVVSSVPITIPTGWPVEKGRDGWASGDGDDGFERELYAIFDALASHNVNGLIWLSADVHFATGFELRPLPHQPEFRVRELIVGPLSAGIYPTKAMDPTFSPTRLYYHAPPDTLSTLDEALRYYNFGDVRISADGELRYTVINGHGEAVFERVFEKENAAK
jgi:alkaline phosphatase D